jgi:hypothetical protein
VSSRPWANEIRSILDLQRINGGPFWSREDGNIHAPAGFATLLVLNVLGELGATAASDEPVSRAVEFLFGHQTADGAFRHLPKAGKLPCIAGQALAALGRLGVADDPRAERGYRWLLDTQWEDGGWRCATVRLGKSPQTDASNPGTTLFVLDAFRFRQNAPADEERLNAAVESLLGHWHTRAPLGPCSFGIGTRFLKVEFPFWRYNLFYYVYVLSHYRCAREDKRFAEAAARLRSHPDERGDLVVDAPPRDWQGYPFAPWGRPSELATERWREIEANLAVDARP